MKLEWLGKSSWRCSMAAVCMSLMTTGSDWWFGTFFLWLSTYWECHHPNWRSHIFQGGWNHQPGMQLEYLGHIWFFVDSARWPVAKKSHSLYEVLLEVGGFARTRRISHGDLNDSEWKSNLTVSLVPQRRLDAKNGLVLTGTWLL